MRNNTNNLIAIFVIFLMLFSLAGTTLISYYAEKKATAVGQATTATVGVSIVAAAVCGNGVCESGEDSTSCPADCPATPAGGTGGGGGGGGAVAIIPLLTVDQSLVKVQLKKGDSLDYPLTVTAGRSALDVTVEFKDLVDILGMKEINFTLDAKEEKELIFKISSGEGVAPGVYSGTALFIGSIGGNIVIQVPVQIIVEVESKRVVLDVTVNIPENYKRILSDSDLIVQTTVFDIGGVGPVETEVTYLIRDFNGDIISESNDTITISDQASFSKTLHVPEVEPGNYVVAVNVKYKESVGTASDVFEVISREKPVTPGLNLLPYLIALVIILAAIFLFVNYMQHKRLKHIEKSQKTKIVKVYKQYTKKKHTSTEDSAMIGKLNKQLRLLKTSYDQKYIGKDAYDKGRLRVNSMIRKLKKE